MNPASYAQQYTIRILLTRDEDAYGKIEKNNISVVLKNNYGDLDTLQAKRIGFWPFFKPENMLEIKYNFSDYLGEQTLIISYKEDGQKWEHSKIRIMSEWFSESFINGERGIDRFYGGSAEALWESNVSCTNKKYQSNNHYKFDIKMKKKRTIIKGRILDASSSKPIDGAIVLINNKTNKELMGDKYKNYKNDAREITDGDGKFEFSLDYMEQIDESGNSISSENLKEILDHIKIIIIKEDYEPLVKNCPLSSVGANKELGDLYIESFETISKETCPSPKLVWDSNCYECLCIDRGLRWDPEHGICSSVWECEEGLVPNWNPAKGDYECVNEYKEEESEKEEKTVEKEEEEPGWRGIFNYWNWEEFSLLSLYPTENESTSKAKPKAKPGTPKQRAECAQKIEAFVQFRKNCNYSEAKAKADSIYLECYDRCNNEPIARLLADVFYKNILYPQSQSSESYIKEMLTGEIDLIETDLGKAIAGFELWERMRKRTTGNNKATYTSDAITFSKEAMLFIRVTDVIIKNRYFENQKLTVKYPIVYKLNAEQKPEFNYRRNSATLEMLNKDHMNAFILETKRKIKSYKDASPRAISDEYYRPISLENWKDYFTIIGDEG